MVVTKRSHIFKQTCSFELQVCLSMYDLFLQPGIKGLIIQPFRNNVSSSFSLANKQKYFNCTPETYLEPSGTSTIKFFAKIVRGF